MQKNGWDKEQPATLNFIDTKEKKEDGWISDIVVGNGNHRMAMVNLYKVNTKIPIKFEFNSYHYLEEKCGKKDVTYDERAGRYSRLRYDEDGNEYWPLRKMIKHEYDK